MLTQSVRAGRGSRRESGEIDRLNAVSISAAQIAAAMEGRSADDDVKANTASNSEIAAALHARVIALAHWRAAHDPHCQANCEALIEASARFPLTGQKGEPGFEPAGFQELALFIEELPW